MTRRFWTLLAATGAIALSSLILGKEPAQSQTAIGFYCGVVEGLPATVFRNSNGTSEPWIIWRSDLFTNRSNNFQEQCQQVSNRLETYRRERQLQYITVGRMNGEDVVCTTSPNNGRCENLIFTLKPGQNSIQTLIDLLAWRESQAGVSLVFEGSTGSGIAPEIINGNPAISTRRVGADAQARLSTGGGSIFNRTDPNTAPEPQREEPAPPPMVRREEPAPPPMVRREEPAPPPMVRREEPAPPPMVRREEPAPPPMVRREEPAPPPMVRREEPAPPPMVRRENLTLPPLVRRENLTLPNQGLGDQRVSNSFYCGMAANGYPATLYRDNQGRDEPWIIWGSNYFAGAGYDNNERCQQVSTRLETYRRERQLQFITVGRMNGEDVVCTASPVSGRCENLIFTLKPGQNSIQTLINLLAWRDGQAGVPSLFEDTGSSGISTTVIDGNPVIDIRGRVGAETSPAGASVVPVNVQPLAP